LSVVVRLPGPLRPFAGGRSQVRLEGKARVDEALLALPAGVRERILDEQGALRPHVNVFVDGTSVREQEGLSTLLRDGAQVFVIPAISGGAVPE
jgi:molybdopterin synthase sulfur carrier subunit